MNFKLSYKYIVYTLFAKHSEGHGIHSPFVFNFVRDVFLDKNITSKISQTERVIEQIKNNKTFVERVDLGVGTRKSKAPQRVDKIARIAGTPIKYGRLLHKIINYLNINNIVELGTSVGIGSLYLSASDKISLTTIEGDKELCNVAKKYFEIANRSNIKTINGNFDEVLDDIFANNSTIDMFYIDGNHSYEATIRYFNKCLQHSHKETLFVFDDIYWSAGMEKAWKEITENPKVTLSIDIWKMGLVFISDKFSKQNFVIKY